MNNKHTNLAFSNARGKQIARQICQVLLASKKSVDSTNIEPIINASSDSDIYISHYLRKKIFLWILKQDKPSIFFTQLKTQNLLRFLLPYLDNAYGITQNKFHSYDIFYHSVYACDAAPQNDLSLRISALFHDLGKVPTRKNCNNTVTFYNHEVVSSRMVFHFCRDMRLPKPLSNKVFRLVRHHMFHYTKEWTDSAVRRFYQKIGPELLEDLFALRMADRQANGKRQGIPDILWEFRKHIADIVQEDSLPKVSDLHINGYDLMRELSISPGPMIGQILQTLLEKFLANKIHNERDILLQEAKHIYQHINH